MTEITDIPGVEAEAPVMSPAVAQFVLHWGDMGGQWGVNRSVAQIQALLYLSDRPLHADDIGQALGIARSNVSTSLKELLGWKLIRRVPIAGDRRDHFEAEADLWQMLTRIAQGRKEREIDPAVAALKRCRAEADADTALSPTARARIAAMHEFVTTMDGWYQEMIHVPPSRLLMLIRMGRRVLNFLPKGRSD